jgi:probable phosphoglycerate mutase
MTVLAFVRHGITDWNTEGRAQGHQDIPLNDEGRRQAYLLSLRFSLEQWDYIYSSDLSRAAETARTIAKMIQKPVIYDIRLREIYWGALEGTTIEERVSKWGANWSEIDHGLEHEDSLRERGLSFVQEISNKYPDSKILAVSHGALLSRTLKVMLNKANLESHLDNTSISILNNRDGDWTVDIFNSMEHMNQGRPRACAAIIRDNHILMVREMHEQRDFWTLPGGGLEFGESYEEAVVREVKEEVNLEVKVIKHLFTCAYENGSENCYLVEIIGDSQASLGYDPEYPLEDQVLRDVKWFPMREKANDHQVSRIIESLKLEMPISFL